MAYFENIANYVENGGALLVSSGRNSPRTDEHLPHAAGQRAAGAAHRRDRHPGFQAAWSPPLGLAHPVTRDLPGSNNDDVRPSRAGAAGSA